MEEKKTQIPLVKLDSRYKMIIPPYVEQKIRHLCNRVWEREWSGTLFYKAEGSFEDNSLVITCTDIFVMDIGSSAYTEFDMSPDVMSYMTEHPELMECQMGLIHSHNNMPTFFSGTDISTLSAEGEDRNHFVSLIVNNAGTYTAAITRKVKSKRDVNEDFSYESFEGVIVNATDKWEEEIEEIQYFNLEITKEGHSYSFSDVDARLDEIKKLKEARIKPITINQTKTNNKYVGSYASSKTVIEQPRLPFDAKDTSFEPVMDGMIKEQPLQVNPKIIHSLCLQLLTGSIMIPNESKIDISRWVKSMDSVVKKRFGEGTKGYKLYKDFIDTFVEYLVWETEDPDLTILDKDYMMNLIATGMMEYLGTLPQNTYTKICQSALLNYITE